MLRQLTLQEIMHNIDVFVWPSPFKKTQIRLDHDVLGSCAASLGITRPNQ